MNVVVGGVKPNEGLEEKRSTPQFKATPENITKRDGSTTQFKKSKITNAILKAFRNSPLSPTAESKGPPQQQRTDEQNAEYVSENVVRKLLSFEGEITVEKTQDIVERELMAAGFYTTARAYITYRNERTQKRTQGLLKLKSAALKRLTSQSSKYFASRYEEFIYLRTYSRWREEDGRRENWLETVERFMSFMKENLGDSKIAEEELKEIHDAILTMEIMPSMRLLQFAGPAARRNNLCVYNCCFVAPTCLQDLRDIMYVSMCGTGVGWSVERKFVEQFPLIASKKEVIDMTALTQMTGVEPEEDQRVNVKRLKELASGPKFENKQLTYTVEDSKEGWCDAFLKGLETWYVGRDIEFDFSKVRPAGARLKTMGGRASGPEPLKQLLEFSKRKIQARQGSRLTTLDMHDIICMIGQIVVVGGVRRSAMISISDLDDEEIRNCKSGSFWVEHGHRCMANNSAAYDEVPDDIKFMKEWLSLASSGTGERGIFNRVGLTAHLPERRVQLLGKERIKTLGTNPCGEVILQSHGLCNLTTVVCRPSDTEESLTRKIRLATILGTYQATLTDFGYVSEKFKARADEERLLGVSMTGQQDCPAVRNASTLRALKKMALETNAEYAKKFGIRMSSAITLVKPEGTVSEMVNSASGVHPRFAKHYVRRVRISAHDPLFHLMKSQGVMYYPEVGQVESSATTFVLEFPIKSPEGSVTQKDMTAESMLEYWKLVKTEYCEHNPSVTVNVDKNEWVSTMAWLRRNWDIVGGLAFLPKNDHIYKLAPYESVSESEYEKLAAHYAKLDIDYSKLVYFEKEDATDVKKEAACVGGTC